jgi:hypothetical protein
VVDVLAAAAVLLAWFVFRYDRHGKQREALAGFFVPSTTEWCRA